uniref:Uncharacterized protein n=1 Tax=Corethron hystrix TaxID=216773 RepID=A0A7S1BKH3_9STRA|mmetsp:Transcript_30803/g.70477  ORF Transcript_30803/g.70477 Transcript_30803/m.70477 type:complete len:221 (+) Transcript_30803:87-749(+)
MGFATARRFKRKQSDIETRTPSLNISIAAVLKPCAIFMMGIFVGVFFVSPSSITITSQVPISGVTRPNGGSSPGNLSVPSVQSLTGKNKGDDDFFSTTVAVKGKVVDQENIPARPTSHVDPTGRSIMKQQFLEAFVVPRFVGVSLATLKPGQEVTKHEHESLHEFFYGIEGEATAMFLVYWILLTAGYISGLHAPPQVDRRLKFEFRLDLWTREKKQCIT